MPPSIDELSLPNELHFNNESSTSNESSEAIFTSMTSSKTEIKVEHIKHSWAVENFSHCYLEYLENFVHLPIGEETLTWSIKLYPKGNGENNKDFVFLCLSRVKNNDSKKIGYRSKFFMRTSENKEIDIRIHPNPSNSDYVCYIKRGVLFQQILPADSFTVLLEIDAAVDIVTTNNCDTAAVDIVTTNNCDTAAASNVTKDQEISIQVKEQEG